MTQEPSAAEGDLTFDKGERVNIVGNRFRGPLREAMKGWLNFFGVELTRLIRSETVVLLDSRKGQLFVEVGLPLRGDQMLWGRISLNKLLDDYVDQNKEDPDKSKIMLQKMRRIIKALEKRIEEE
jgi:hypothetical protein